MVADDFLALIASTLTGCLIVGFIAALFADWRGKK